MRSFTSNISRSSSTLWRRSFPFPLSSSLIRFSSSPTDPLPSITKDLDKFFLSSQTPSINHQKLQNYLKAHQSQLNPSDIYDLLVKTSKLSIRLSPSAIASLTEGISNHYMDINRTQFAQFLFSLKDYENSAPEITNLRGVLLKILRAPKFQAGLTNFDSRSLGMCFYGLKNMNYDMKYVPELVNLLVQAFKETSDHFNIHTIAHITRGLTCLNNDHPLTKELLGILHSKLIICDFQELMETKDVVNVYRSFQSLSLKSDEVSTYLREILPHIDRFHHYMTTSGFKYHESGREPFSSDDLVNMYRGIAKLDWRCEETSQLYSYLHHWIQSPSSSLTINSIARIMHSLTDQKKIISPLNETLVYLCNRLLELVKWDPDRNIAATPLSFDEITLIFTSFSTHPPSKNSKSPFRSLNRLLTFSLRRHNNFLTSNDIYRLFFGASSLSSAYPEDGELFLLLGEKLQHPSLDLSPKTLRAIVNSLRYMNSDSEVTSKFLVLLTEKLQKLPNVRIDDKWGCIYGLQSLSSANVTVRAFLKVLNSKLTPYPPSYTHTAKSLGCTIFGLQLLQPIHPEVRDLLRIITSDYQSLTIQLDNQAICNIFFGIQNLYDLSIPESRQLVQLLIGILKRNQNRVTHSAPGILQMIIGIRKFSPTDPHTLDLLEIIATSLQQSPDLINFHQFVNSLNRLQNFPATIPQVEAVFVLLLKKFSLATRKKSFSCSEIIALLSALRPFSTIPSSSLSSLLEHIDNHLNQFSTKQQINSRDFLSSLLGIHQFSFHDSPLVPSIIHRLLFHTCETDQPYTIQEFADYLHVLHSFPIDHILTIDLMYYLIQRLPPVAPQTVSSSTVLAVVMGLKNKNLQLLETKVLLNHALTLMEHGNSYQKANTETCSPKEGDYSEDSLVEICRHLSEYPQISEEYRKLLSLLTETVLLHSPRVDARKKVVIENFFIGSEQFVNCEEMRRFLDTVQGLPECEIAL